MSANSNRRAGLKHEGLVRKWFTDLGFVCLNLASNSEADLSLYTKNWKRIQRLPYLLEAKRVRLTKKTNCYYVSKNAEQHEKFKELPNPWYCVSFFTNGRPPVTVFVPAHISGLVKITPAGGYSWEQFLALLEMENT